MGRANALSAIVKSGLESKDDGREKPETAPAPAPTPAPAPAVPQVAAEPASTKASTSREGKKFVSIYVEPAYHKRLRQAGLDHDLQVQEILRQALDDWMVKHKA